MNENEQLLWLDMPPPLRISLLAVWLRSQEMKVTWVEQNVGSTRGHLMDRGYIKREPKDRWVLTDAGKILAEMFQDHPNDLYWKENYDPKGRKK